MIMQEKINQLLEQYRTNLERKQRLLQPYIDKKNESEEEWNIIDQENYSRLKAETEMLKRHIDDLKWILE
jgi:2-oxoglutarate dehydrogenase complex dehydrogenase (E1) component-like enzyme